MLMIIFTICIFQQIKDTLQKSVVLHNFEFVPCFLHDLSPLLIRIIHNVQSVNFINLYHYMTFVKLSDLINEI